MTQGFDRSADSRFTITFDAVERGLLTSLANQVLDLVAPDEDTVVDDPLDAIMGSLDRPVRTPEDAALARLFPDAYRDDAEAAEDFRRFTEQDLRLEKCARATSVKDAVATSDDGDVTLTIDESAAVQWLGFLNDVRLILGTRLGITEDWQHDLADLPESDPRIGLFHLYDWLTYMQETLVQSLIDS